MTRDILFIFAEKVFKFQIFQAKNNFILVLIFEGEGSTFFCFFVLVENSFSGTKRQRPHPYFCWLDFNASWSYWWCRYLLLWCFQIIEQVYFIQKRNVFNLQDFDHLPNGWVFLGFVPIISNVWIHLTNCCKQIRLL